MSKISLFVASLAVAAGFSTALLGQQTAAAELKGNAANGKDLFVKYTCYSCHGFSAQNGPARNRLNPMTMTVTGFIAGVRAPATPNSMPPFSTKVISDQQLADIWTYVKTLPSAPAAKDIPLLEQIKEEASK